MDHGRDIRLTDAEMLMVYEMLEREFDDRASVGLFGDGLAEIELVDSALLKVGAAHRGFS